MRMRRNDVLMLGMVLQQFHEAALGMGVEVRLRLVNQDDRWAVGRLDRDGERKELLYTRAAQLQGYRLSTSREVHDRFACHLSTGASVIVPTNVHPRDVRERAAH